VSEQLIRLGHSPDPDDAFMFYALAEGLIPMDGFRFEHVLRDIETLNRWAAEGRLEVTALSVHAYAHLADRYRLLPHGASMGERYGPIVVARQGLDPVELPRRRVAIPGTLTSAFLQLQLAVGRIEDPIVLPFDEILDAVAEGRVEAGLIIHEGQLTYGGHGLHKVLDLGAWWKEETSLPLPLGANAVRRDLGPELMAKLTRLVRETVRHSLAHRPEALAYAMEFARGMDPAVADRFVGMWVNEMTLDIGERGRRAVQEFLDRGHAAGVIPNRVRVDFVDA
jgi:1,4-dihydroxy-6-naphthoate synthase